MTNFRKAAFGACAFIFVAGTAFAQLPAFAAADTNADGALSMEEAKTALPNVPEAAIVAADENNNGSLSPSEYAALIAD